jgi:hypothetical protein
MMERIMSSKIYIVKLRKQERRQLEALIGKGKSGATRLLKARIPLKADCGPRGEAWPDERIIEALDTNASMVYRVRRGFAEKGLEAVLTRKKRFDAAWQKYRNTHNAKADWHFTTQRPYPVI